MDQDSMVCRPLIPTIVYKIYIHLVQKVIIISEYVLFWVAYYVNIYIMFVY